MMLKQKKTASRMIKTKKNRLKSGNKFLFLKKGGCFGR